MQRTLRVIKAITTESVELATYRLQDIAVNWYDSWELSRGENAPTAVWQEFTEAFLRHCLQPELRWAGTDRFLTLRQGNMSVREYILQFDSLAMYAPTIVSKIEDRVHRFMVRLEPHFINDCLSVSLQPDMDISCIEAYAQGVEERSGQNSRASGSQYKGESSQMRLPLPRCAQCGSTLLYVTPFVASKFEIKPELVKPFEVSTPVGDSVIAKRIKDSLILIPRETILEWEGNTASPRGRFVSYLKTRKIIRKGCIYHLVRVQDVEVKSPTIQSIPVVNEFLNGFPDELLSLPPKREIESEAEHVDHLCIVLRVIQKGKLYAKFPKYEFWLNSVAFLGHNISGEGIRVDTQKIEAVKTWPRPTTPMEALKDRLTLALVLTLLEGTDGCVIYCDASAVGLDTTTSSLVTEVKERQYEDPVLVRYRDTTPQKEKTPFEIVEDGVLRYRG
ncbi:uncharacterized protein [Nicotiana sylvestris]|uniref:uncharacterized protein n=1 Tax=Nicotiana sylvestris TaxID=4096 RepID=UPI00388C39E6